MNTQIDPILRSSELAGLADGNFSADRFRMAIGESKSQRQRLVAMESIDQELGFAAVMRHPVNRNTWVPTDEYTAFAVDIDENREISESEILETFLALEG